MLVNFSTIAVDQGTSVSEQVLYFGNDWAGRIDYHAIVKNTAVGTLGIIFRWNDRNGTAQNHTASGLSLLTAGPVVSNGFILWSEFVEYSPITVELTLTGIVGSPVFDFFCMGYGETYTS